MPVVSMGRVGAGAEGRMKIPAAGCTNSAVESAVTIVARGTDNVLPSVGERHAGYIYRKALTMGTELGALYPVSGPALEPWAGADLRTARVECATDQRLEQSLSEGHKCLSHAAGDYRPVRKCDALVAPPRCRQPDRALHHTSWIR